MRYIQWVTRQSQTTNLMETNNQPRFLKWSLVFAIAIVSNLFINYALSVAYKSPVWNDFCPNNQVIEQITTKDQCVAKGGQWNANVAYDVTGQTKPVPAGYCDPNYTCQMKYTEAQAAYDRVVFIVLVIAGVVMIALGLMLTVNGVVKTALSFSGSLSLVIASMRYWGTAHDWLKVVILGVALAALIFLAVKKFGIKQ